MTKHPDYDHDPTTLAESRAPDAALLEQVLIGGDLAKLNAAGRLEYYLRVCESIGVNPTTRPFEYITLNGKLRLYALRDCTEQLRKLHGISVTGMHMETLDGVYVVRATFTDKTGRQDQATGAVPIGNLKGEALANAFMKAETKCKRRGTLSICGLGMLDESEVESIPGAKTGQEAITASQPPPMPRRLSETAVIRAPISELEAAVAADRPLIVPDAPMPVLDPDPSIVPDAEPVTRDEANAIYGAIRRALREIGIDEHNPDNLKHAKSAVKQWAAAELGIAHLEDCPVGKPYLRLRGEIGRLVADAFDVGARG